MQSKCKKFNNQNVFRRLELLEHPECSNNSNILIRK